MYFNDVGFNLNGVQYYYVKNLQGDVVKVVDGSGAEVASYSYDAWGKVLTATGAMASVNPIRYRGYYYDSESNFYYLKSRYYNPQWGRFVNADILFSTNEVAENNIFVYCRNNPVNRVDNEGERSFTIISKNEMKERSQTWSKEFIMWIEGLLLAQEYVDVNCDNEGVYLKNGGPMKFTYNNKEYELYRFETTVVLYDKWWCTIEKSVVTYGGTVEAWNAFANMIEDDLGRYGDVTFWVGSLGVSYAVGKLVELIFGEGLVGFIVTLVAAVGGKVIFDSFDDLQRTIHRDIQNHDGGDWYIFNWSVVEYYSDIRGSTWFLLDYFSKLTQLINALKNSQGAIR